jgi:hypothetical protein
MPHLKLDHCQRLPKAYTQCNNSVNKPITTYIPKSFNPVSINHFTIGNVIKHRNREERQTPTLTLKHPTNIQPLDPTVTHTHTHTRRHSGKLPIHIPSPPVLPKKHHAVQQPVTQRTSRPGAWVLAACAVRSFVRACMHTTTTKGYTQVPGA